MVEWILIVVVVLLMVGLFAQQASYHKTLNRQSQAMVDAGTDTRRSYQEIMDFFAQLLATKERDSAMQMGEMVRRLGNPYGNKVRVKDDDWAPYLEGNPDDVEAAQERGEPVGADDAEADGAEPEPSVESADIPDTASVIRQWARTAHGRDVLGAGDPGHREGGEPPFGGPGPGFGVRVRGGGQEAAPSQSAG